MYRIRKIGYLVINWLWLVGIDFKRKGHLESHEISHLSTRLYTCGICGKGCKRKEHLEQHKIQHVNIRPYICKTCGKSFKRKSYFQFNKCYTT